MTFPAFITTLRFQSFSFSSLIVCIAIYIHIFFFLVRWDFAARNSCVFMRLYASIWNCVPRILCVRHFLFSLLLLLLSSITCFQYVLVLTFSLRANALLLCPSLYIYFSPYVFSWLWTQQFRRYRHRVTVLHRLNLVKLSTLTMRPKISRQVRIIISDTISVNSVNNSKNKAVVFEIEKTFVNLWLVRSTRRPIPSYSPDLPLLVCARIRVKNIHKLV